MQALFYMDMYQNDAPGLLDLYCRNFQPSKRALPFLLKLVKGVLANKREIDATIEKFSANWKLSRMACVDRNILRIAVFELLFCNDIPSKVSINEAVDVGKKFGTEESGAFINGILDSIRLSLEQEEFGNHIEVQTEKTT